MHVLSDMPDLSLVLLFLSGFPAQPLLVLLYTDSSSSFIDSIYNIYLYNIYIFNCRKPVVSLSAKRSLDFWHV